MVEGILRGSHGSFTEPDFSRDRGTLLGAPVLGRSRPLAVTPIRSSCLNLPIRFPSARSPQTTETAKRVDCAKSRFKVAVAVAPVSAIGFANAPTNTWRTVYWA